MKKVKWISVEDSLPEELDFPHERQLWLLTSNYGTMSGMFLNGIFMKDYSSQILSVTHWFILPNGLDSK